MPLTQPRWAPIGQYSNVPLKPLPIPPKELPHKLGSIPLYIQNMKQSPEQSKNEFRKPQNEISNDVINR